MFSDSESSFRTNGQPPETMFSIQMSTSFLKTNDLQRLLQHGLFEISNRIYVHRSENIKSFYKS